jgi:hypothetical protein
LDYSIAADADITAFPKASPTSPKPSGCKRIEECKRRATLEQRDSARVAELDK